MSNTSIMPSPRMKFFADNGRPLAGGLVYTWAAGTVAKKDAFTDSDKTAAHPNPIILDEKGEATIYWDGAYKVDVRTAAGVSITGYPVDNFKTPVMDGELLSDSGAGMIGFLYSVTYGVGTIGKWLKDFALGTGSTFVGFIQAGAGAVLRTIQAHLRDFRVSVKGFGALGDGATNDTAAFALARTAAGNGAYHIPNGTYVLDAAPNVFLDNFSAGDNVTLVIAGVPRVVSNAFCGGLSWVRTSATKVNIVDAVTGNIVMYLQDGGPGTATGFFRGLAVTTDSHWIQVQPATNGGSTDLLWQRSTLNADPAGNRFNFTFNEGIDRLDFSFATTASGAPVFDTALQMVAGLAPEVTFPAVQAMFNQGWAVKQRAAGGFKMKLEPFSSTVTKLQQEGGSATEFMRFGDNSMGFFGAAGGGRPTITGSRGGNVALTNLLANLAALGLVTDSTTA